MTANNTPLDNTDHATMPLAVLIDADNVSPLSMDWVFQQVRQLGDPIVRRAYGMVGCFSRTGGWPAVQRQFGLVARPQVSNVLHKNVADIALVIDAMTLLYNSPCDGICIVSSDSDFTAVAARIREEGKAVFGFGDAKTPESFRTACTGFYELPRVIRPTAPKESGPTCPRCGGTLVNSRTKAKQFCQVCPDCNGMFIRMSALKGIFDESSLNAMQEQAKLHEQLGCVCPCCGESMSILKVSTGSKNTDIDVCDHCQAIWYDESEYEALVPNDGPLLPTISAGKAFRRDLVLMLTADLREGRVKANDLKALQNLLKKRYFVPTPDIASIISSLRAQQIIVVKRGTGAITIPSVNAAPPKTAAPKLAPIKPLSKTPAAAPKATASKPAATAQQTATQLDNKVINTILKNPANRPQKQTALMTAIQNFPNVTLTDAQRIFNKMKQKKHFTVSDTGKLTWQ